MCDRIITLSPKVAFNGVTNVIVLTTREKNMTITVINLIKDILDDFVHELFIISYF